MFDGGYNRLGYVGWERRCEAVESQDLGMEGGVGRRECLGLKKTSESGEEHFYFPIPFISLLLKIANGTSK